MDKISSSDYNVREQRWREAVETELSEYVKLKPQFKTWKDLYIYTSIN